MRRSYRKPKNHQDFEILCLKLLRAFWKSPGLDLYRRSGQPQDGVDIIDMSGGDPLRAAQCKNHEEGKTTTWSEIESEVDKAKRFPIPLGHYVLLTSGRVTEEVHPSLIALNQRHRASNLFLVEVMDWRRIEELLDEYSDVRDWYEGGLSVAAAARIEGKLDQIMEVQAQSALPGRNDDADDQLHREIDEARDYVKGHDYQVARLLLQRIRTNKWDRLNARHRFRVMTNLAAVELGEGKNKEAAALYLEAKQYQPDDETALANETLAYLMLAKKEQAFELADKLRKSYPLSERIMNVFIRAAPESMSLESIKQSIPEVLLSKQEVALAIAHRAFTHDSALAEEFVRPITSQGTHWSAPWLLLGEAILRNEISQSQQRHGFAGLFSNKKRIEEAETAFTEALTRAKEERSTQAAAEALVGRGRAREILDKDKEAFADMEEARRVAPEDTHIAEVYGQSLRFRGRGDDAIDFLRRIPTESMSDHGRSMYGMLLLERGRYEDISEAANLFSKTAVSPTALPGDFREHAIELALEAFAKVKELWKAPDLLKSVPSSAISEAALKTLSGKLCLLEENLERSSGLATEALTLVDENTSTYDVRRLAQLLKDLGRHKDALPLWQRLATPTLLGPDTRELLDCANRLNRHDIMLSTFESLRNAGVADRKALDYEITLLERYDSERAIELMKEQIGQEPGDKRLRLMLSMLGLALDRQELVDSDPNNLPDITEVTPQLAINVVQVLRGIGRPLDAIQYAYELLRSHFEDPDAHRAFILSMGPVGGPEPELTKPEYVEIGSAVCYVEQGVDVPRWIVVVEGTFRSELHELSADHDLCKAMLGKKVGDTFTIAHGVQDRIGEIKEVQNRYVHRYQDCMTEWQIRFPALKDIQIAKVRIPSPDSGDHADIGVVLESVDRRYEDAQRILTLYRDSPLTLHVVGEYFGDSAFGAIHALATSNHPHIKCCLGSAQERDGALSALRSCNTIVVEMSAIATLFLLDRLDILENWKTNLVVSQGTLNEISQLAANESRELTLESGVLIKTEGGHAYVKKTPEQRRAYVDKLRHLVDVIDNNCDVKPCRMLAGMDPERRELLLKAFGQYGAEAVALSSATGAVLWTDDQVQAGLAQQEYGSQRVWTQVVIGTCAEAGVVSVEAFLDVSAKLIGCGYSFTSSNSQIVLHAAKLAEWKVERWPFLQALNVFGHESIDLMPALQLASGFLRLIYQEPILAEAKTSITVRVLEQLAKKKGGLSGIVGLQKALPRIFGLNVIGVQEARATIDAWVRAHSPRHFEL